MARQGNILLTICNKDGSVQHYFHFMLGFLVPMVIKISESEYTNIKKIYIRSCGPMDNIIRELNFRNLIILDDLELSILSNNSNTHKEHQIRHEKIMGYDVASEFNNKIFQRAGLLIRQQLIGQVKNELLSLKEIYGDKKHKLLIIYRGSDPFYQRSLAERKGSGIERRSIPNLKAIEELIISRYGNKLSVIPAVLEGKRLATQIALFQSANIILAQHGATLANLIFSKKGVDVIEICPPRFNEQLFASLSECLNLNHNFIRQFNNHAQVDAFLVIEAISSIISKCGI